MGMIPTMWCLPGPSTPLTGALRPSQQCVSSSLTAHDICSQDPILFSISNNAILQTLSNAIEAVGDRDVTMISASVRRIAAMDSHFRAV